MALAGNEDADDTPCSKFKIEESEVEELGQWKK